MAISEQKMKIVIENYFKAECNVDTSIREAFEKGFRIGVKKALSEHPEIIRCKDCKHRGEKPITDGRYWCDIHDTFMYYCSDAERRTNESNV